MAHSKEAHGKMGAMKQFNEGHHEKKMSCLDCADGKYTSGEMDNPMHLEKSVKDLANYAKKHKMQYP
jgi:hypothetical protein